MTVEKRRKIAQIAAKAYTRMLESDDIPESNEEYDYFLSVLLQKISLDLSNFLAEDFTKNAE